MGVEVKFVCDKQEQCAVIGHLSMLARFRQQALSENVDKLVKMARQTPQERQGLQQHWKTLGQHCSRLILEVEAFRRWVVWGCRALAELPVLGAYGEDVTSRRAWISEADISLWLLDPACRCLAIVKSCSQSGLSQCLPRKFHFWADELQMGVALAGIRVSGAPLPDLTALRFQLHGAAGEDDGEFCVKNTFVDVTPKTESRRSHSSSRSPRTASPATSTAVVSVVGGSGTSPKSAVDEKVSILDAGRGMGARADAKDGSPVQQETPRGRSKADQPVRTLTWDEDLTPPQKQDKHLRKVAPAGQAAEGNRLHSGSMPAAGDGMTSPGAKGVPSTSTAWWKTATDVCPISKFPISLLPYPPFKLQKTFKGSDSPASPLAVGVCTYLVDGGFLVVQVIASLRFEALGRSLDKFDVEALDAYMKRCRLGNFRLGMVLRLMRQDDAKSRAELESLRQKAQRRLSALKQIQRNRLARHITI